MLSHTNIGNIYRAEHSRKTFKFHPKELIGANEDFISLLHGACKCLKYTADVKKGSQKGGDRPLPDEKWRTLRYPPPQKATVKKVYRPAGKQKFLVKLILSGFVADVTFTPSK